MIFHSRYIKYAFHIQCDIINILFYIILSIEYNLKVYVGNYFQKQFFVFKQKKNIYENIFDNLKNKKFFFLET